MSRALIPVTITPAITKSGSGGQPSGEQSLLYKMMSSYSAAVGAETEKPGGIEFDALISEENTLESTVPAYAVETGFSVTDTVILNPQKLSMVVCVTNTPVTWYHIHGKSSGRVASVLEKLEELYYKKTIVTVSTTDRDYENMVIESMTISKSFENGYAREIPISFVQVMVAEQQTTTIPDSYGKSGNSNASAGTSGTTTYSGGGGGGGGSSGGNTGNNNSIRANVFL